MSFTPAPVALPEARYALPGVARDAADVAASCLAAARASLARRLFGIATMEATVGKGPPHVRAMRGLRLPQRCGYTTDCVLISSGFGRERSPPAFA